MPVFNRTKTLLASFLIFVQCFSGIPAAFAGDLSTAYQDPAGTGTATQTVAPQTSPAPATSPTAPPQTNTQTTTTTFLQSGSLSTATEQPQPSASAAPATSTPASSTSTTSSTATTSATPATSTPSSVSTSTETATVSPSVSTSVTPKPSEDILPIGDINFEELFKNTEKQDLLDQVNKLNQIVATLETIRQRNGVDADDLPIEIAPDQLSLNDQQRADFLKGLLDAIKMIQDIYKNDPDLSKMGDDGKLAFRGGAISIFILVQDYAQFRDVDLAAYAQVLQAMKDLVAQAFVPAVTGVADPDYEALVQMGRAYLKMAYVNVVILNFDVAAEKTKALAILDDTFNFMKTAHTQIAGAGKDLRNYLALYKAWLDVPSKAVTDAQGTPHTEFSDKAAPQISTITDLFLASLRADSDLGNVHMQLYLLERYQSVSRGGFTPAMSNFMWGFLTTNLTKTLAEFDTLMKNTPWAEIRGAMDPVKDALIYISKIGDGFLIDGQTAKAEEMQKAQHSLIMTYLTRTKNEQDNNTILTMTSVINLTFAVEMWMTFTQDLNNNSGMTDAQKKAALVRVEDVLRALDDYSRSLPVFMRTNLVALLNLDTLTPVFETQLGAPASASLSGQIVLLARTLVRLSSNLSGLNDPDITDIENWAQSLINQIPGNTNDSLANIREFADDVKTLIDKINTALSALPNGGRTTYSVDMQNLRTMLTPFVNGNATSELGPFLNLLESGAFTGSEKDDAEKIALELFQVITNNVPDIITKTNNFPPDAALEIMNTAARLAIPLMRTSCAISLGACDSLYAPLRTLFAAASSNTATGSAASLVLLSDAFRKLTDARKLVAGAYTRHYNFPMTTDENEQGYALQSLSGLIKDAFDDFDVYLKRVRLFTGTLRDENITDEIKSDYTANEMFIESYLMQFSINRWATAALKQDATTTASSALAKMSVQLKGLTVALMPHADTAGLLDSFANLSNIFRQFGINPGATYQQLADDLIAYFRSDARDVETLVDRGTGVPPDVQMLGLASNLDALIKLMAKGLSELNTPPGNMAVQTFRDTLMDGVNDLWDGYRQLMKVYEKFAALPGLDPDILGPVTMRIDTVIGTFGLFEGTTVPGLMRGIDAAGTQFGSMSVATFKKQLLALKNLIALGHDFTTLAQNFGTDVWDDKFMDITEQ